jgi:hypothetical protein
VNCWINKTVKLNDNWGPGAVHTLATPVGKQPEFSLRPRYLRDAKGELQLAHFSIDFPSGYLADGWQGVNLTPMGSVDVKGISGLPEWDPSQRDTYRKAIEAATSLGDSRTLRLEGVIPYVSQQGSLGYNKVRLFYVFDAVKGKIPDLVVVKVSTHSAAPGTVHAQQDGNGQGPPH